MSRKYLVIQARRKGLSKIECASNPCRACAGTVFYTLGFSGVCVSCKNKQRGAA